MKIAEALLRLGELVANAMKAKAPSNTGRLRNSIKATQVVESGFEATVSIEMLKYGQYQDSGVRGTQNTKGFANPQSFFELGQFSGKFKMIGTPSQNKLPYPVRISIYRNGLAPQPFVKPAINEVIQGEGLELLAKAGVNEIIASSEAAMQDVKISV